MKYYVLISSEPKPVYAQPGQPDVDLPVSPADAPVPSVTPDDSILRYGNFLKSYRLPMSVDREVSSLNDVFCVQFQAEHEAGEV